MVENSVTPPENPLIVYISPTMNLPPQRLSNAKTVALVSTAPLTGKVAGDPRHVATHEPHGEGQAVVFEDVCHQVHVVGAFAGLMSCCVETSCCCEREEHHLWVLIKCPLGSLPEW